MESKSAPVNLTIEKNYDSEMCGSIPLHLVNLVQPHGVLLVLDKVGLSVRQVSENATDYFGVPVEDILEKPLAQLLPEDQYKDLLSKVSSQHQHERIPLSLNIKIGDVEDSFSALLVPQKDYILLEIEKSSAALHESFLSLYQNIKYVTTLLKQANTMQEVAQIAADEMKKLTGFDRVLIYRFDPQWNGIVVAQAKEESMDDFMDLRFPASDVPKQARDLYYRNPYRFIPNREYEPVRLIPVVNPITQQFTDLSECNLRSVANVHLEYLANLNIKASMSLPIIINDKLWGLISCHNIEAKYPSYELRSAMELLTGIISAQLEAKQKEEQMALRVLLRNIHGQLVEQLYTSSHFSDALLKGNANLLDFLSLSGAAILYEGSIWTSGDTPENQDIKELASWLRRNKAKQMFVTDTLPFDYPHSKKYKDVASGLIALPINAEQGEFIIGFRPEVIQTVNWGGNPNNAIQMEPDGKTYHPRNSFATYKETVKFTSIPWKAEEVEAAEALRNAVFEKMLRERY